METAFEYGILLKPKVLVAMLLLYAVSFLSSYSMNLENYFKWDSFLLGNLCVIFAVSGANALNSYLDRDIDRLMYRTKGRPLVTGTVADWNALMFSLILLLLASLISMFLGLIPFLIFIEGTVSYLLVYTILLKRRSSLNVLATAPSIAAPGWFGWYLGGTSMLPVGFFTGVLVSIWGPLHLWSLAYAFSKDYERVGVPMLSTVMPRKKAAAVIFFSLCVMIGSSYVLIPWTKSLFYLLMVTLLNLPLAMTALNFYKNGENRSGWWIFKLSAPYIVIVLTSFMIDQFLHL
jgi:protoheme IX farnesyltransferase